MVVGLEGPGRLGLDPEALPGTDVANIDPDGAGAAAPEQSHFEAVAGSSRQLDGRLRLASRRRRARFARGWRREPARIGPTRAS